jgi:hypothetical protein
MVPPQKRGFPETNRVLGKAQKTQKRTGRRFPRSLLQAARPPGNALVLKWLTNAKMQEVFLDLFRISFRVFTTVWRLE